MGEHDAFAGSGGAGGEEQGRHFFHFQLGIKVGGVSPGKRTLAHFHNFVHGKNLVGKAEILARLNGDEITDVGAELFQLPGFFVLCGGVDESHTFAKPEEVGGGIGGQLLVDRHDTAVYGYGRQIGGDVTGVGVSTDGNVFAGNAELCPGGADGGYFIPELRIGILCDLSAVVLVKVKSFISELLGAGIDQMPQVGNDLRRFGSFEVIDHFHNGVPFRTFEFLHYKTLYNKNMQLSSKICKPWEF